MTFDVAADAYGRFMGRYSEPLADQFVARAGLREGQRVLDVGCGPGALTARLVDLLGLSSVAAVDPSASFVEAARSRFPGLAVSSAVAEELPFPDGSFDASLAQLVVHFMTDPVAGLAQMRRVTRTGGAVAACVWDHAGGGGPLAEFWRAVSDVDPDARGEVHLAGTHVGHLVELSSAAGLSEIDASVLSVTVTHPTFEDWWDPYTLGVGPAGAYVAGLDEERRARLRARCAARLPAAPFTVEAKAWCVVARA